MGQAKLRGSYEDRVKESKLNPNQRPKRLTRRELDSLVNQAVTNYFERKLPGLLDIVAPTNK